MAAALLLCAYLPTRPVSAHPLDMYAQTQAITLDPQGVQVDWKITPGPLLALGAWDQADQDHDGQVSPQEAQAWLMPFLDQWSLTVDSQPLGGIQVAGITWPASVDAFQSGNDAIDIRLVAAWPQGLSGTHTLAIHNANQEAISLNWFSLTAQGGLSFTNPNQSNGQLTLTLGFGPANPGALYSWESGQPILAGLTGAVSGLASNLAGAPTPPTAASSLSGPTAALVRLVQTGNLSGLFLIGAFLLSLALGSLHALTPGHGKTLVAAYLVGSHGKLRDAIFLGSVVTLTHTGSVLIFGLLALVASRYIFPSLITPWLEVLSGLAVVVFGISLLVSRGRSLYAWYEGERAKKVARHFQGLRMTVSAARPLESPTDHSSILTGVPYSLNGPTHTHPEIGEHHHAPGEHEHSHAHTHALPSGQVTWKSLLALGVSGGLVPCPDAIAILVVAVAIGRIPLGMLLIVAFSLGLALVLIAIGIAMVQGAHFLQRSDRFNRFSLYTPVLSAVLVSGLGIGLTVGAVHSVQLSSSALAAGPSITPSGGSTPAFDLQHARLVYLSLDSQDEDQLTVLPLSGGQPSVLTQEPNGVQGYSLAPDRSSVLYATLDMTGASALWSLNLDGSGKHKVLDCPQAECEQPVWYPGSQKVVYARHDYTQNSASPMFSIWWLDLTNGETQPVFQDGTLPGNAPAFSPDGQWLSYISPATNTLQIYNLQSGRVLPLPLSNQTFAEQFWGPASDSILYWEPAVPQADAAVHVKRYLIASGQKIDLGGSPQQADYQAAWSPDDKWVAIVRDGANMDPSSPQQQIWLVHPDGSGGHQLLQDQGSYSDLSWSPDGHTLVYVRNAGLSGGFQVWLADIESGKLTQILGGGFSPQLVP